MYNILNWNTALTEDNRYLDEIVEYIREYLNTENAIAILQQIPYKDHSNNWEYHYVYNRLKETFPESEYTWKMNNSFNNGYIIMQTVLITKIKIIKECGASIYPNAEATNREVAVYVDDKFSILGIHARNGKDNLTYIQRINSGADIIVGDFNAGDYNEYTYCKEYRKILDSHVCICNMPTKEIYSSNGELLRKSCIDHIYIRRNMVTKCENMVVHNKVKFSDHYPITFCLNI